MKNTYSRPNLNINYWLVSKEDLKRIYNYFKKIYGVSTNFSLETASGNNKVYENFSEFENNLDEIKALKEEIQTIHIGGSHEDKTGRTHAWLLINFIDSGATFFIVGEDINGDRKNIIDGIYADLISLSKSLQLTDRAIIELIDKKFQKSFLKGTYIINDIWSEKMDSIKNEIAQRKNHTATSVNQTALEPRPWWKAIIDSISKLTQNQTMAIIIGAIVFYLIYRYSGIDLNNLSEVRSR